MGLGFGEGGLAFRREALGGVGGIVMDGLAADGFALVFGDSSELEDTFFLRETLGGVGGRVGFFVADADADAFVADAFVAEGFAADAFG